MLFAVVTETPGCPLLAAVLLVLIYYNSNFFNFVSFLSIRSTQNSKFNVTVNEHSLQTPCFHLINSAVISDLVYILRISDPAALRLWLQSQPVFSSPPVQSQSSSNTATQVNRL